MGQNHLIPLPNGRVTLVFSITEKINVDIAKRLKYAKTNIIANVLKSGIELLSEK
jgi:hypothetical protein